MQHLPLSGPFQGPFQGLDTRVSLLKSEMRALSRISQLFWPVLPSLSIAHLL